MDGRLCGACRASGSSNYRLSVRAKPPVREARVACDIFWGSGVVFGTPLYSVVDCGQGPPEQVVGPAKHSRLLRVDVYGSLQVCGDMTGWQ